jgi:hypothetical protein
VDGNFSYERMPNLALCLAFFKTRIFENRKNSSHALWVRWTGRPPRAWFTMSANVKLDKCSRM